jgi:hypothetical protein
MHAQGLWLDWLVASACVRVLRRGCVAAARQCACCSLAQCVRVLRCRSVAVALLRLQAL